MTADRGKQAILTLLGVSAGVATGVWLWRRGGREADWMRRFGGGPRGSAQDVAEALRSDHKLGRRSIEVDAIAEGVVELSGAVRDREESDKAVAIAQGTTGVYTVVNRLRIDEEETLREATRRRWNEGAPELRERHRYGLGSGMGTRRQSPETDPDRPSDKQRLVEKELEVGRFDDDVEEPAPPSEPVDGVETSPLKPGSERTIEEAGLNPNGTVEPTEDGREERQG